MNDEKEPCEICLQLLHPLDGLQQSVNKILNNKKKCYTKKKIVMKYQNQLGYENKYSQDT